MANQPAGKAPSDSPALKPYRGKLAVRNFRGGNGNVGIIRSPVRAIALPDCGVTGKWLAPIGRKTAIGAVVLFSGSWLIFRSEVGCGVKASRRRYLAYTGQSLPAWVSRCK